MADWFFTYFWSQKTDDTDRDADSNALVDELEQYFADCGQRGFYERQMPPLYSDSDAAFEYLEHLRGTAHLNADRAQDYADFLSMNRWMLDRTDYETVKATFMKLALFYDIWLYNAYRDLFNSDLDAQCQVAAELIERSRC